MILVALDPRQAPPAAGGPPRIPPDAAVNQKRGQAIMIWAIGMFCVFCWEWIICLPEEIRRIWRRPPTFVSVLYLVNRYFGLIQFSIVISLVANVWGQAPCKVMFRWEPVGALLSNVFSQMIMGARVYALYGQSRSIAILLITILLIEIVVGGVSINTVSIPKPIPGAPIPCGAVTGPVKWLIAFWSIPLLFDTLAFLLTTWKAYSFWRQEISTPLIDVIWRDGIMYFAAIFSMNFANLVIFLTVPKVLQPVNLTPTLMLTVIMSCRLVLNIRDPKARDGTTRKSSYGFGSGGTPIVPHSGLEYSLDKSKGSRSPPATEKDSRFVMDISRPNTAGSSNPNNGRVQPLQPNRFIPHDDPARWVRESPSQQNMR